MKIRVGVTRCSPRHVSEGGVGKVKHLDIRTLWIQSKIKDKEVLLECIDGLVNPGDLGTQK